ncbi:MFS general substrate transporter [Aureobasidium pullulans]|nr:MFS general substrate transporter [Aureobasidium pullulans]THW78424.1 MFS general substrate transporter [Aureobasidium pullulans]
MTRPENPSLPRDDPETDENTPSERTDKREETSSEPKAATIQPYTIFGKRHKRVLTVLLATASLTSPFTQTVYLPLLPLLGERYAVSNQSVNLTITFYSVVQAVTPALFAPFSDNAGRRPVTLFTFLIYTVASLALALVKSEYVGLLLLRGLQALGASASVSIAYGIIADVCVPSERGSMIGPVMSATNVGTLLGPIFGGLIAWRSGGQEWVFWGLVIFGTVNIGFIAGCLPETARSVVGDGSRGRSRQFSLKQWMLLGPSWIGLPDVEKRQAVDSTPEESKRRMRFGNPLASLKIMLWKDAAFIIVLGGVNYAVWNSFLAMMPSIYENDYGWNQLKVGLAYLPGAVGVISGDVVNGRWMDHKYRKTAGEVGLIVDGVAGDDLDSFPIEKARCRDLFFVWIVYNASLASLGWVVQIKPHVAISLVLQASVGFFGTFLFFCFNTLLIDVHPESPSTAAAAATVVRCGLSALAVAIMQPLVQAIGRGWYLTLMTLLIGGVQGLGLWAIPRYGQDWRKKRREKLRTE